MVLNHTVNRKLFSQLKMYWTESYFCRKIPGLGFSSELPVYFSLQNCASGVKIKSTTTIENMYVKVKQSLLNCLAVCNRAIFSFTVEPVCKVGVTHPWDLKWDVKYYCLVYVCSREYCPLFHAKLSHMFLIFKTTTDYTRYQTMFDLVYACFVYVTLLYS